MKDDDGVKDEMREFAHSVGVFVSPTGSEGWQDSVASLRWRLSTDRSAMWVHAANIPSSWRRPSTTWHSSSIICSARMSSTRKTRTGASWRWCWTGSSSGSSPSPPSWERSASCARPHRSTTTPSRSIWSCPWWPSTGSAPTWTCSATTRGHSRGCRVRLRWRRTDSRGSNAGVRRATGMGVAGRRRQKSGRATAKRLSLV